MLYMLWLLNRILKVGVGALDDRTKILSDYCISMVSCVDLRHMAGRHKKSWYVCDRYDILRGRTHLVCEINLLSVALGLNGNKLMYN